MSDTARLEDHPTADADGDWWDVRSGPGEVVDRLLHPRATRTSDSDWWEATVDDVIDRLIHPLPDRGHR